MEEQIYKLQIGDKTYEIDDFSEDVVYEVLVENFFTIDIFDEIPATKKIVCNNFVWDDLNEVYNLIDTKYKGIFVKVFNEEGVEVACYELTSLYKDYAYNNSIEENGDIIVCSLWSDQLENFIEGAEWRVALESSDGILLADVEDWPNPIIENLEIRWIKDGVEYKPKLWYGISDTQISDIWVLQNDKLPALVPVEHGLGSYGGQLRIKGLEINYGEMFEGNGSWFFGACGNSGADFNKVIDRCPIVLLDIYKFKNGFKQLGEYCCNLKKESNL